ncbi:TraB/GumN family protein [Flavihumibacter sp. RY-1]|uniref:TraB/GumN family protein n=1 Tax=Flavihumibacter fluminis TaxID=2909236 RepID=A0ABS9BLX0_9BACT|nr:TraB/GumN family protein [Flavihumibacter fluminis]MCF1716671.1 TraB/GumN family protein [Flavihumibacter fluminis]
MGWLKNILLFCTLVVSIKSRSQVVYKVVSPGRDTITYLIGTYSPLTREQFQFTPLLDSLLDEVELVFTESFYEDKGLRQLANARERIKIMSYPNQQRLEDVIGREEAGRVYAYYHSRFGIKKRVFKQLSYYIPIVMDQQIRYGNEQYIKPDRYLLREAEKKGKRIYNLDQPALTQGAFEALAKLYPPDWLVQLTRNDSVYLQEIKARSDCYLKQDTACLKAGLREKIKAHPAEYVQLIARRTLYWKGEIERNSQYSNLVLASIDNLLEEEGGLLEYFRRKGYTIQLISRKNLFTK